MRRAWGIVCLLGIELTVRATTVLPRRIEDLAQNAPVVVYGKVVQIDVQSQNGFRTATIEAFEVVRAPEEFRQNRDFLVPLLNRALPHRNLVEVIPSAPDLRPAEEVVVFLRPLAESAEGPFRRTDGKRLFTLEGFYQGKARVFSDALGIRRVAAWDDLPEVDANGQELLQQKTTPRLALGVKAQSLAVPAAAAAKMRTLDALLNLARGSAQ